MACAEKDHRPSGRELQIVCKGPSGEEEWMWRTKCGKSHVYLPTSSAAKLMTKAESLLDIGYYRLGFFSFSIRKRLPPFKMAICILHF